MYSTDAISALNQRIRWNDPLEAGFNVTLSNENKTGTSGRHFQRFHQLVTVENIYAAVQRENMNGPEFNEYLADMRKQAVLDVLSQVFDQNPKYVANTDYSDAIMAKAGLFDNAVGLAVATTVLELFKSTGRKNFHERNAKLAMNNLNIDLEGYKENGAVRIRGIASKYQAAINKASSAMFPVVATVSSGKIW